MGKALDRILKGQLKGQLLKKYGKVKIYCGGGNIEDFLLLPIEEQEKRLAKNNWKVTWSYRDPVTDILTQQIPIKAGNKYTDFKTRYKILSEVKKALEEALKNGHNPYELKEQPKKKTVAVRVAFIKSLEIRKHSMADKYFKSVAKATNELYKYLESENYDLKNIQSIDRAAVVKFLNKVLKDISAKTRNDYRTSLNGVFKEMLNQGLIKDNFIPTIEVAKHQKKISKTYSRDQIKEILDYLEGHDKQLLLFIKLVSYQFLRPIDIVRLKVSDIDLKNGLIIDHTKKSDERTKRIPAILLKDLSDYLGQYKNSGADDLVFTKYGVGQWPILDGGRRKYFTTKFFEVKKKLNISKDYNIYSMRHTFITALYQNLRAEGRSKSECIDYVQLCTGQKSKVVWNYIHLLSAELPEDYSDKLKIV